MLIIQGWEDISCVPVQVEPLVIYGNWRAGGRTVHKQVKKRIIKKPNLKLLCYASEAKK